MNNPINTLSGIKTEPEFYPTIVVQVDSDGNVVYKEVTAQELNYDDFRLESLIKAGIDPASLSWAGTENNRLSTFTQLSQLSSQLESNQE